MDLVSKRFDTIRAGDVISIHGTKMVVVIVDIMHGTERPETHMDISAVADINQYHADVRLSLPNEKWVEVWSNVTVREMHRTPPEVHPAWAEKHLAAHPSHIKWRVSDVA